MSFVVVKTTKSFEGVFAPYVVFGTGVVSRAPAEAKKLGISKVLVVTDKGVANTEGCKAMVEGLKAAGLNPVVWSDVLPDPPDTSIDAGVQMYLNEKCDGIIGIGGGSSIDSAKAVGCVAANGGVVNDYNLMAESTKPIAKMPPIIAIPTTAGTGSEVTFGAVITGTKERQKFFLWDRILFPKLALVDPNLTLSLPPQQTAATGLDALTHAVEGYLANTENPIGDALAVYVVELIFQNLRRAVYSGSDIETRTNMALASLMAGLIESNSLPSFGHAIGHTLGSRYHIPHGIGCILDFPVALDYIRAARQEKLAKLAQAIGVKTEGMSDTEAARAFIEAVAQLMKDVGIPSLAEATGMTEADIPEIAKVAVTDGCNSFTPRPFTVELYTEILTRMLAAE